MRRGKGGTLGEEGGVSGGRRGATNEEGGDEKKAGNGVERGNKIANLPGGSVGLKQSGADEEDDETASEHTPG